MKELIFIGGYGQSHKIHEQLKKCLCELGYKITFYTLYEGYKEVSAATVKDKIVITHSAGILLIKDDYSPKALHVFNAPEPIPILRMVKNAIFRTKYPDANSLHQTLLHMKEILRHPITHAKVLRDVTSFSASSRLIKLRGQNKSAELNLYVSDEDEIFEPNSYKTHELQALNITVHSIKSRHRTLHTNPKSILKQVKL